MKKWRSQAVIAGLILFVQSVLAQNVKLANIAFGMSETEVKTALASNAPFYVNQASDYSEMHYLVAETKAESYAFTMISNKVVGFSVMHILPPGQLPFLPPGQQPTVSVLRALITKQTWPPAEINKGDTWWFSDTTGAHLSDASLWRPESGEAWLPLGPVPGPNPGKPPAKSTEGLMKPSSSPYPSNCGQYSSQSDAGRERRLRSHLRSAPGARHQGNERLSCKASTAVGSSSGKSNESCRVRIEMTDVIVVIGAGSIGQAIVRRVSAGKHVLLADIRQENADAAAKTLFDAGFNVSTATVDVSSRASVHALVEAATKFGEVSGVIHAAGVSPSQASPETILKVDLYGTALVLEEFGNVIARGGSGIVIASQSGHRLGPLSTEQNALLATTPVEELLNLPMLQPDQIKDSLHAYQLSKRANSLRVMAEAVRWGKRGARVNTISPGIIITPLANDELKGPRGPGYRRMIEVSAAGRAGTPDEVGTVGALLMGPDGAFITGSDFLMDGGVTAAYWFGDPAPK